MATATAPLSRSILFRDQQKTLELLRAAADELARVTPHEKMYEEVAGLLAQLVLLCLRSPDMMRDLWEWGKAEETAGRLRDRVEAAAAIREQLENWLDLVNVIGHAAAASAAADHPVNGADELGEAATELQMILLQVDEAWPPQEQSPAAPLPYDKLRRLADRHPPPPEWYAEEENLF